MIRLEIRFLVCAVGWHDKVARIRISQNTRQPESFLASHLTMQQIHMISHFRPSCQQTIFLIMQVYATRRRDNGNTDTYLQQDVPLGRKRYQGVCTSRELAKDWPPFDFIHTEDIFTKPSMRRFAQHYLCCMTCRVGTWYSATPALKRCLSTCSTALEYISAHVNVVTIADQYINGESVSAVHDELYAQYAWPTWSVYKNSGKATTWAIFYLLSLDVILFWMGHICGK